MHADVDARETDRDREQKPQRSKAWYERRQHSRRGKARRGMAGGKRVVVRRRNERLRRCVARRRTLDVDHRLECSSRDISDCDRRCRNDE